MKVTRIAYSRDLNQGKYAQLNEQAIRLGGVRSLVWRQYGSIAGTGVKDRTVRDQWMRDGTAGGFGVLANAWKETVRDAFADITANREAAKVKVRRAVSKLKVTEAEKKRLFTLLKRDQWKQDPYLSRMMRKHWRRGRNKTINQIAVRSDQYRTFTLAEGGNIWIAVPGLERRQLVTIPLNTTAAPTGTLRLILRNGRVEVHYAIDAETTPSSKRPCGSRKIGVDKGYTEVLTDSDGQHHGPGLGQLLSSESDHRKAKGQRRAKLRALAEKAERRGDHANTSQAVPFTDILGVREGDRLHCTECGAVWQADHAGAINIEQRDSDPDITLFTPHTRVKQILLERAGRQRSGLPLDQDSSTRQVCRCGERIIQPRCSTLSNE
ncbi:MULTISPECIES: hypothetical protein [Streptomyces]|uniref:hypothetical protein n=1 Tax=Streptomyces lycopersici TaxID=2974589 RepID=UPI0021D21740|nr:hypothetical protein [Streptomyces sp. NEAU-383]